MNARVDFVREIDPGEPMSLYRSLVGIIIVIFVTSTLTLIPNHIYSATFSTEGDSLLPSPSGGESEEESTFKKVEKSLFSNKSFDNIFAINYFKNHLHTLLKKQQINKDHLKRLYSFLGSEAPNTRARANEFFNEHIKDLMGAGLISSDQIAQYSHRVYDSPKDHLIFLGLMNAMIRNGMATKQFMSPEYSYNVIDGLDDKNKNISDMSTLILSHHGETLSTENLLAQSHVTRFINMLKELPRENFKDYLNVFEKNLNTWVSQGLIGKKDVQTILRFMTQFPDDLMDQLFQFLTKPKTIASLQKLGLFDKNWATAIKKDIIGSDPASKQNSLDMLSYLLIPFVQSGAMSGKDFREIWKHIQNNMDGFDNPFVVHDRNYKRLARYGWFNRNDYERLLFGLEEKSVNTQARTLEFVDSIFDWLRVRNWVGTSEYTKALPSTGKTLNLRKLGFKPLANAVLADDSSNKSLELQKASFVGDHMDTIIKNELFTQEYVQKYMKKLYSNDPEVFEAAAEAANQGLSDWYAQGILTKKEINSMFAKANPNANRTARLIEILDRNFGNISKLFDQDMVNTYSYYIDSSNPKVAKAAASFFTNHVSLMVSQRLLSNNTRSNIRGLKLLKTGKNQRHKVTRKKAMLKGRQAFKDDDDVELIGD